MKVTTDLLLRWDGSRYLAVHERSHDHDGAVHLCCGASQEQTDSYNSQKNFSQLLQGYTQQVFGSSSKVFNDLVSSLAPVVAAGPNQEGFSPAEKSALQSQAITNAGVAYRNAKAATGNAIAAQGGGNTGLTSGANIGRELELGSSASENTANQLNQINQADYQTGRQNYGAAVSALSGATSVFNPSIALAGTGVSSGVAQADTANQIAQQNNSWVQAVTGALGGVAGAATGGWMAGLGRKK